MGNEEGGFVLASIFQRGQRIVKPEKIFQSFCKPLSLAFNLVTPPQEVEKQDQEEIRSTL